MNPCLDSRFGAAKDPADLGKAEVLFEAQRQESAVSPSKTQERPPHLLALDVSQGRGCRIERRRLGPSVTQRREQATTVVDRKVDRHPHQPRPLIRLLAEAVAMLPQSQKRVMTNLLSKVGIEDNEVDGADDEWIKASVKRLERGAAVIAFGHISS